MRDTAIRRSN
ncbi:hypothetical protein D030_1573A, partial [Vibrio parahaemolyticus AQ3810]